MPYAGLLHPEPLQWATADLYLHMRHSDTVLAQSLGGNKQNFVHTRTQEIDAVTPQETDPDMPMSV